MVRFPGLKERSDTFEFVLDDSFFAFHNLADWNGGMVNAHIEMEKKPDMVTLSFALSGNVEVVCDRCLEPYHQEISAAETLYVKFGDESEEIEENIVIIPRDQTMLEVSQYLYEYIALALPVKKVHPEDRDGNTACDPEMLEKLEAHNQSEEQPETDPRWDELKKLIEKK